MNEDIKTIVANLNIELNEKIPFIEEKIGSLCSYHTDGFMDIVEFAGMQIWNSDDDMRAILEEETHVTEAVYESLKDFLVKEIQKIINMIGNVILL